MEHRWSQNEILTHVWLRKCIRVGHKSKYRGLQLQSFLSCNAHGNIDNLFFVCNLCIIAFFFWFYRNGIWVLEKLLTCVNMIFFPSVFGTTEPILFHSGCKDIAKTILNIEEYDCYQLNKESHKAVLYQGQITAAHQCIFRNNWST